MNHYTILTVFEWDKCHDVNKKQHKTTKCDKGKGSYDEKAYSKGQFQHIKDS